MGYPRGIAGGNAILLSAPENICFLRLIFGIIQDFFQNFSLFCLDFSQYILRINLKIQFQDLFEILDFNLLF